MCAYMHAHVCCMCVELYDYFMPINAIGGHSKMRRESATPLVENSRDSKCKHTVQI